MRGLDPRLGRPRRGRTRGAGRARASVEATNPRARNGPSASSSSRSATTACGPATSREAAVSSRPSVAQVDADRLHVEQVAARGRPRSRACARARAARSPGRRPRAGRACARARGGARPPRSSARSACAARAANDATPSELSCGTADERNTSWRTPTAAGRAGATRRSSRRGRRARRLAPRALPRRTAGRRARRRRPLGRARASPSTALRQSTHPAAPVASAASRAIRSAPRASSPPAASASAASISAEPDSPAAVPSAYARRTSAAWPAATRAASRSAAPKGRPRGGARASAATRPSMPDRDEEAWLARRRARRSAGGPARARRPRRSPARAAASTTREPSISAASAAFPATARTTSSPRRRGARPRDRPPAAARAVSATAWSASAASAPDARRSAPAESAVSAGVRDSTAVKPPVRAKSIRKPRKIGPNLSTLGHMAEPAHRRSPRARTRVEAPPLDPTAVDRAYHFYRARRHAKIEHRRATRMAHARFWAFLGLLLLAVLVLGVTVWGEITKLFGSLSDESTLAVRPARPGGPLQLLPGLRAAHRAARKLARRC